MSIFSFGLTNFVLKDLSHECIEILYECEECGNSQRFTAEINKKKNTYFGCGYYEYEYDERSWHVPRSMTVEDAERIYCQLGKRYNILVNNCMHWCSRYWNRVTQY